MLQFKSLTNVRPTKDLGCQIVCAPTEGQFKITPEAADILDVRAGDYLQLVEADGTFYAVKGGEVVEGGGNLGGKLASSNKTGGGVLTLSAAAAWQEMDGNEKFNTHYNIDTETSVEQEERTYYPLAFAEKIEKQARVRKNKDEEKGIDANDDDSKDTETFDDM